MSFPLKTFWENHVFFVYLQFDIFEPQKVNSL